MPGWLRLAAWSSIPLIGLLVWANFPSPQVDHNVRVDRVTVYKGHRRMELRAGESVVRTYRISLGANPEGHKKHEGDERTPEGEYVLDRRNPDSIAHLSYHISYPNRDDRRTAKANGLNPGGLIMVHGLMNGLGWLGRLHRFYDWTNGCIAITNSEMSEFWRAVPIGTPIEIHP